MNNIQVKKDELDDYKYLHEEDIDSELNDNETIDINSLKIEDMDNYNYIKNMDLSSQYVKEKRFLLEKEILNDLDSEDLESDYLVNLNKGKRKAESPKEPYSDAEKEIVAEENMALVHYVLRSLHANPKSPEYDEFFSIAVIGYAKALNSYDKSKNVKFSTYAINCIRNEIFYVLRKEKKHKENTISFNTVLSTDKNGNSLELGETLSQTEISGKGLEELLLEEENKEILLRALQHLKEEERFILIYRFGLDRGIIKTQKEIADAVGMSQANVSKIQKSCLNKLKLILKKEMKHY